MSYQKCPICNGNGIVIDAFATPICPTCRGARIIDEITGLPPEGQIVKEATTTTGVTIHYDEKTGEYKDHNGEKLNLSIEIPIRFP